MSDGKAIDREDRATDGTERRSQVAQRHFEPDGTEELTTAIVFAVADAMGVEPHEVRSPPLYESVDAAALEETFFGPGAVARSRSGAGSVEFHYVGYIVSVRSDGWIQVYERAETEAPE
ncbi:MAG: HalOD1 output domain-containing protein [Haloarculaceae archaeon]